MDKYFNRFPSVLKKALKSKKVKFPDNLEKEYDSFEAYRGVRIRKENLNNDITKTKKEDFLSQIERDMADYSDDNIYSYSCSCFTDTEELMACFKLPRKNKGIAKGSIKSLNGPIAKDKDNKSSHIHWFLYEGARPEDDFKVVINNEGMD